MQDDFTPDIRVESEHLSKLSEQKNELLLKVQTLKKELVEWRTKLDGQVKSFRGVSACTHSGEISAQEAEISILPPMHVDSMTGGYRSPEDSEH
jgi:hypothetical protein